MPYNPGSVSTNKENNGDNTRFLRSLQLKGDYSSGHVVCAMELQMACTIKAICTQAKSENNYTKNIIF
jgi:hypothetical protein